MRTHILFISIFIFSQYFLYSQEKEKDIIVIDTLVYDKSIPDAYITLDEIIIIPPPRFESQEALFSYHTLRWMVKRIYPFAKLAADKLNEIETVIDTLKTNKEKRKYIKSVQKFAEEELGEKLKKYTIWEGQILIKLIYRQTGKTCYQLVKELRNSLKAFMYNITASFFDMTLKRKYNPRNIYKDYLIEDILQREFAEGDLEKQQAAIHIDYYELTKLWRTRGIIIINEVDVMRNKDKKRKDRERKKQKKREEEENEIP